MKLLLWFINWCCGTDLESLREEANRNRLMGLAYLDTAASQDKEADEIERRAMHVRMCGMEIEL